jgi:hypothetical protein
MSNIELYPGALLSTDFGTDAIFTGLSKVTLSNTRYPSVVAMAVQGFNASSNWFPIPGGNIGPTKINYTVQSDHKVDINGLGLGNINGANLAVRPTSGILAGNLATITLTYIK